jgi:hypothetical protein
MSTSCLHTPPLWGFVTASTLRVSSWVRPRLAPQATATLFAGCFATLCQPLRGMACHAAGRKRLFVTALSNCYAVSREPRHFDPVSFPLGRSLHFSKRVAVASLRRQAHGLRPHCTTRPLGRSMVSAPPDCKSMPASCHCDLLIGCRSTHVACGSPALHQNR